MFESSGGRSGRPSMLPRGRNAELPRGLYKQFGSFRDLVAFAFPGPKPEVVLADLTKKHQRTCERWLSGEVEPPGSVVALVMSEFLWSLGQRLKH